MKKKIIIKEKGNADDISHLMKELGVSEVIAGILVQRGIKTFDEAKTFFRPELSRLHDPFLMKDMDIAVKRLETAISNGEKILVYGDYDVDGTTSVALVYSFLRKFYDKLDYYVPDRYSEGYGISFQGIDFAEKNDFSLIIALDCGIKAVDKIEYANQKGVDFIICDHHTVGDKIPDAVAVLDPKRPDCEYPFKELCGCGVGFKFMQGYAKTAGIAFEELTEFIDLLAVSIAADIVPVTGENRILAFFGLKKFNENPIPGLQAIRKIARVADRNLTISDLVFKIGPRINAAGRIKSGKEAVQLMVSGDEHQTKEVSKQIDIYNEDRKHVDRSITHEALHMIGNNPGLKNRKSTVVFKPDWHKGVVGIVASRLIETYYRPTIVLTESKGLATGSARSVYGFNVYDAIDSCSDLLVTFGGHMYAAGLSLKVEDLPEFTERFNKYVSDNITEEQLTPFIEVDTEISFAEVNTKFFRILKQFAPFGPGNLSPVFLTKKIRDTGYSSPVGQTKEHLRLDMIDYTGGRLKGIAFSMAHHYRAMRNKSSFSMCYSVNENEYNGRVSLQAMVKEIQMDDD